MPRDPEPPFCMPEHFRDLAIAIRKSFVPTYTFALSEVVAGKIVPYTSQIQQDINLWIEAGSDGIVEYQLLYDGGDVFTTQWVKAGERIVGHFKRIGPGTTVYPLVGYGNLR